VLPEARRQGLGGRLLAAASRVAREAGKTGFQTDVSEARPEALAFLAARGFVEVERTKIVALDLRGMDPPPVDGPAGIELTNLAARPDLERGLYDVALEGYPDIPSVDEPVTVGDLEEFLARDIRRAGIPPEALAIAVDRATGRVAGWGSLLYAPGSRTVAWHDMTVVARAWRGRGIATALKRSVIRWAIEHGVESLQTGNDETNAPMRAVNRWLGYAALPDLVTLRGPLAPEE
jgi:GNAT superfamily N-acetyltransferase